MVGCTINKFDDHLKQSQNVKNLLLHTSNILTHHLDLY